MMPLLVGSLLVTGCFEEEEDDYTPDICNDFDSELNNFQSKVNAFNANPTRSSCSSLKQSAITLMNKVRNCPGGEGATYAIQAWQDVDCNAF